MIEQVLVAAGLLALLVLLSFAARAGWERYRRGVVRGLREAGPNGAGSRIVYFSTSYCVACRELQEPALERLSELAERPITIERVDPLEQPDLARRYRVVTVPTTAVFGEDGRLVEINYGFAPLARLAEQLGVELPESARTRYEI